MTAATVRQVSREVPTGHGRPGDFRHHAACRSQAVDPEVFFPIAESGPELARQVEAATTVCAGCSVRSQCLSWALSALPDGIAGGMTEGERRTERGRRARARRRATATATDASGMSADEGEGASVAAVAPSRISHEHGLAGHTSCGRTPRVDDDPCA
jgi:hypothetical protein